MKVVKTDKHYMAEPDFEIDHYKDASYPPVASHYHEFYEIFLFVSGNADYVVHDKMFRLKPGDLLIIPPAIMHHPIFRDFEIPYSTDGFGTVSGSFSKFILVDATLLTDFFDIVDNRHKNSFFQILIS